MEEDIVERVRRFVKEEFDKPEADYKDSYDHHFKLVVKYGLQLAEEKKADKEIVEISCWLHDIASIMGDPDNHHVVGAKIAEEKLTEFGYLESKIESVKHCIISHRGSNSIEPETIEAKIVVDADAMSQFDDLEGNFEVAFIFRELNRDGARKYVREKLIRSFNKLNFEESKELIKPKYEAAMLLLK